MRIVRLVLVAAALASPPTFAQTQPGSGAPSFDIVQAFVYSWLRNGFYLLVADPPLGDVAKYGPTGLRQEFQDVAKTTGVKYALILPNQNAESIGTNTVWQVQGAMYAYYLTVTQGVAGYPSGDTTNCPAILTAANLGATCQYQFFDKKYALFAYSKALSSGTQNFSTRDPFYTKWVASGGANGLGPANGVESNLTSSFNSNATGQTFDQGAIYNITSGTLNGRLVAVREPVYDLYAANGGPTGSLGLPLSDDLLLPTGMRRQSFEGGSIDFDPATKVATLRPAIASILVQPGASITLNLGESRAATATVFVGGNIAVTDRIVTWSSSNTRVVQVDASGLSATLKAAGAGSANIAVTAEGRVSNTLTVFVNAPCCQIGEGAPTPAISQAFQDAVTRNRLTIQVPVPDAATRIGSGYVQQVSSSGPSGAPYLIALHDGGSVAYVVGGAILTRYLSLGGPGGSLGYPVGDATAAGRQLFEHGALAGSPAGSLVVSVSGAILSKWAALGYEGGAAGAPTGPAVAFLTFRATEGLMQPFSGAAILAPASGPQAGKVFAATGLILAAYNANGGAGGALGAPTGDEFTTAGRRHQDFEGGFIDYAPGDAAAKVTPSARQPLISATPATVLAGTRVRLAAGGFNNNDSIRVSISGQPDFTVKVPSGAYAWEAFVPLGAKSGSVTVSAGQVNGTLKAAGGYTIVATADARFALAVAGGDAQVGAPGTHLAQPLRVVVTDQNGNPAANQAVTFAASAGATIAPASVTTGADGSASAVLQLPMTEGVVLATATAAHQTITFSARAASFTLTNYPAPSQAFDTKLGNGSATIRQSGALLAAVASIVRYYQQRNEVAAPNGLADTLVLNAFLSSFCVNGPQVQTCDGFIAQPGGTDQIVNLWRVGAFAGGGLDVSIESTDPATIRDLVAAGSPVLIALSAPGGTGAHFVVATGISAAGALTVADSNPALAHPRLEDYLAARFTITGAVRLIPRSPSPLGFLITATVAPSIASAAGSCGPGLQFAAPLYFAYCAGNDAPYQIDLASSGTFSAVFTDLGASGVRIDLASLGVASLRAERPTTQWTVGELLPKFALGGIVNAATFTPDLAPGGLFSVFGSGLARAGQATALQVNGVTATQLATTPFQINAQIPPGTPAGAATISLARGGTTIQQPVIVKDVAPAIFLVAPGTAAITNQDATLNTPSNPALRGQAVVIYCTGLGTTTTSGTLNPVKTIVTAVLDGTELPTLFAGLTPGFVGLYQVNLVIPSGQAPGLNLSLQLKQTAAASNTVSLAIQ